MENNKEKVILTEEEAKIIIDEYELFDELFNEIEESEEENNE